MAGSSALNESPRKGYNGADEAVYANIVTHDNNFITTWCSSGYADPTYRLFPTVRALNLPLPLSCRG